MTLYEPVLSNNLIPTSTELPFRVTLETMLMPQLPAIQSYAHAEILTPNGMVSLILGGRVPSDQFYSGGLHTFKGEPIQNFPRNSICPRIQTLNPSTGEVKLFPLSLLPTEISTALNVTNAQSAYDIETGILYFIGGYGWKSDGSDMETSDALLSLDVATIVAELQEEQPDSAKICSAIRITRDSAYKVTGGKLAILNGQFFLIFGQSFDGQYRAFGSASFRQEYTESIRIFSLKPGTLDRIGPVNCIYYPGGSIKKDGHPFHRRDGNVVEEVDPASGHKRLASIGGVFTPGIIGAYVNPILISPDGDYHVDWSFIQKYCLYECPVLVVWSPSSQTLYRTLVGGIGHWYLHQTSNHSKAYAQVSSEKRNDGFPFLEDVTFQVVGADGHTSEYVSPTPIPGHRLLGAAAGFLQLPSLVSDGLALENGVLNLDKFPPEQGVLVGYIYGGIEADNPLPLVSSTGTRGSNVLIRVKITKTPTKVISADQGQEARPTGVSHG